MEWQIVLLPISGVLLACACFFVYLRKTEKLQERGRWIKKAYDQEEIVRLLIESVKTRPLKYGPDLWHLAIIELEERHEEIASYRYKNGTIPSAKGNVITMYETCEKVLTHFFGEKPTTAQKEVKKETHPN
jgi:hypothetical protein